MLTHMWTLRRGDTSALQWFLTLLMGSVLMKLSADVGNSSASIYGNALLGICIVMSCLFMSNYYDDARLVNYYDRAEMSTFTVGSGVIV